MSGARPPRAPAGARMHRIAWRRLLALTSLAALGLLLASCGLPVDEQPEAIPRETLPDALLPSSTTTSTPAHQSSEVFIYLTKGERSGDEELAARRVRIRNEAPDQLPHDVLRHLVDNEPLPEHRTDGLINNIPRQLQIRSVSFPGNQPGLVVVDVSGLGDVEGAKQRLAVAQIVFTLTELEGLDRVQILIDGEASSLPAEGGTSSSEPLSRSNFPRLLERLMGISPTSTSTTMTLLPPAGEEPGPEADPAPSGP